MIRPAAPEDAPHIARIQVETWRSAYASILPSAYLAGLSLEKSAAHWASAIAQGEAGKFLFVIERDGAPRGFVAGGPPRSESNGYNGEIYALYVEAGFQRKSLGQVLFKAGLRELKRLGRHGVIVWVLRDNPCFRFYEKMGGEKAGEKETEIGEGRYAEVGYGWPWQTGLIGGAQKREIRIVDYDPNWPLKFQAHAEKIRQALGDRLIHIEHVGSTSVPGLGAKDLVDIDVVVADSGNEPAYLPALESAGYVLRVREPEWQEHRMLRTPEVDVNVHVFSPGAPEHERHILFRDRLRKNGDDRRLYESVKRKLAGEDWPDTNAYATAKTEVIERILAAAREGSH
jgi:GrpB-like predicted nucleotidyltransferase (UPF0157 family)/GNAT superfamily N-acetyltransferase